MKKRVISYEDKCAIMEDYYKNGGERIKTSTVFNGYALGTWQANLRSSDRRGTLHISEDLRKRFEKIQVIAQRERRKVVKTIHKYEALLQYRKKYPTIKINYKTVDENGEPIGIYREELQAAYGVKKLRLTPEQIQELKDARILYKSSKEVDEAAEKYHISSTQVRKIEEAFGDIDKFVKDYKAGDIKISINQMEEYGIKDFNIIALSSKPITVSEKSALIKMLLLAQLGNSSIELDNKGKFVNIDFLYELIDRLSQRDKIIVELLYGINGKHAISKKNIAKQLHISFETVNKRISIIESYLRQNYPQMDTRNSLYAEQIRRSYDAQEEKKATEIQLEDLTLNNERILRNEYKIIKDKYDRGINDETQITLCTFLSTRARNSLIKAGITTIGQARRLTLEKVASLPNCGEKTFLELVDKLELKLPAQITLLQQLLDELEKKKLGLQATIEGITDKQRVEKERTNNIQFIIEEYDLAYSRFFEGSSIFSEEQVIEATGDAHNKFFEFKIPNEISRDVKKQSKKTTSSLEQKKQTKSKMSKEYKNLQKVLEEQSDKEKMLEEVLRRFGILVIKKKEI